MAHIRLTVDGQVRQVSCRATARAEAKAALAAELARRLGDAGRELAGTVKTCFEARCRFRAPGGGKTIQVAAQGRSKTAAQNALLADLRSRRSGSDTVALKPHSTFGDAARLWIGKVAAKRRGSTHYTYQRWLECRILPDIGGWRLRECTVGQLDTYLDRLAQEEVLNPTTGERRRRYKPNTLRAIRKAISGPLRPTPAGGEARSTGH